MRISLEASALFAQLRLLWLVSEVERASGIGSAETAGKFRQMPVGWGWPGSECGERVSGRNTPHAEPGSSHSLGPRARLWEMES